MKAFNIRTVILALFVGVLIFTSCEGEAASNNLNDVSPLDKQESNISSKQGEDVAVSPTNRAELESMKNCIENLKQQINDSSNRVDKYEKEIINLKEQESSNKLYLLISLILGIISLVIAIGALVKAYKVNRRLDKHGNDIYNLKQISDSRFAMTPHPNGSDDYYQMKLRLKILEDEINALKRTKNSLDDYKVSPYTPKPAPTPVSVVETQRGYFGQPTQADRGYFKSFLTTRDSEARFSAEEKNNVANFEPLLNTHAELETLLHTDAAKLAVDFEGCSLQEANRAKVIKPGVAGLERNRWYIIQKALVALTR